MRATAVVALALLLSARASGADDPPASPAAPPATPAPDASAAPAAKPAPPPTPEQAADAVLAAVRANDDAGLKALAAKDAPDPWMVADELIRRGEFDAADVFAKAAPRVDVERLPTYVASRRARPDDAEARAAVGRVNEALAAKRPQQALDVSDAAPPSAPGSLVAVRLAYGRGVALRALHRLEESTTAFLQAADQAEALGWLSRTSRALHEGGKSAYARSDFAAALAILGRVLALDERRGDRAGVAAALTNIANAHNGRGEYPKALEHQKHALRLQQELGDRAGAAGSLINIGASLDALGNHPEALEYYERGLKEAEAVGQRQWAANALGCIGVTYYELGEYSKALEYYERALRIDEALGSGTSAMLNNIGAVHVSLGNYAQAIEHYERGLKIEEELGDRRAAAGTRLNLCIIDQNLGNYPQALERAERALRVFEGLGDRAGVAMALANVGEIHRLLSSYAKALEFDRRALRLMEELGDRRSAALVVGNIGLVHEALGDYPKALEYGERALKLNEGLGHRSGAAGALGNIGNVYFGLGNYPKALEYQERALKESERLGKRDGTAVALLNIGNLHESLGNALEALEFYERALKILEELGDRAAMAKALGNIGLVHARLEDYAKALECQERALKLDADVGARLGVARTLLNIGTIHQVSSSATKAVEYYERALKELEALGDRTGAASTFSNLGSLARETGDVPKAMKLLERAVREAERLRADPLLAHALRELAQTQLASNDHRSALLTAKRAIPLLERMLGGLGEEQGAKAREQHADLFGAGALAAARGSDAAEVAFFLESGRAGSLMESLGGRQALRWQSLPDDLRQADAEARGAEAVAVARYTRALDGDDRAEIQSTLDALDATRAKVNEVVERIQREAKRAASVFYPRAATLEEIQGWLNRGEAFVLFGVCLDEALALVVSKEEARVVPLGRARDVKAACEALDLRDADAEPGPALGRLRELLAAPLALGDEVTRVLVSPEGPLSYLPMTLLFPGREVAYEPSGTTYGLLLEDGAKRGERVLALGDPDYQAKFDARAVDLYARSRRGRHLVPLPGTREEARSVGDETLLGKDASEAGVRASIAKHKDRWHGIHFACHGIVDPERPMLSSLALTPDAENDGFLTVLEVLRMEVPADLVVLSACETGRGKIVKGEGIVGLTRAFMFAGAPRVICSLWKVDDAATSALMTKFYELWNPKDGNPGLPTAEALRKAQEFVRSQEKWKHPYYWAAWVLWGLPE